MGRCSAASLTVMVAQHQRTETMLAQHLALALTTASVAMQLTSGGIVFDHAYREVMDTGTTSVTVLISI